MSVLYLAEQGATVQRCGGRFVVSKDRQTLQEVPEAHVEQMVLFGNVHLTTPVIAHCLERNIEVSFLSSAGSYRGRLQSAMTKSAEARQWQYKRSLDAGFCLAQARRIVYGKLTNLAAFARRQSQTEVTQKARERIATLLRGAEAASSMDALRGYEGAAAASYFTAFAGWLPGEWSFRKRIAHPPPDPVNALLSLAYTLLFNRVLAAINIVGLDPYQGFLHAHRHGHAALASDLMEEFRPLVGDSLVLKLLKKRMLHTNDFMSEAGGTRLRPAALRTFLCDFEARMQTSVHYDPEGVRLIYRDIIERQVRHFARVIRGVDAAYQAFVVK